MIKLLNEPYHRLLDKASQLEKLRKQAVSPANRQTWIPDIAITRDPGSGGRIIAEMVAKKLRWQFYDNKFLTELSDRLEVQETDLRHVDEHPRSWLVDIVQALINPNYICDVTYIKKLSKLIYEQSKDTQTVFVGHGAGFVLPKTKRLHVRITAPLRVRVENTMEHEKMTREQAEAWVKEVQGKRDLFIRQYFGRTAKWIANYDLILNTEGMTLSMARDIIIAAYQARFGKSGKKSL